LNDKFVIGLAHALDKPVNVLAKKTFLALIYAGVEGGTRLTEFKAFRRQLRALGGCRNNNNVVAEAGLSAFQEDPEVDLVQVFETATKHLAKSSSGNLSRSWAYGESSSLYVLYYALHAFGNKTGDGFSALGEIFVDLSSELDLGDSLATSLKVALRNVPLLLQDKRECGTLFPTGTCHFLVATRVHRDRVLSLKPETLHAIDVNFTEFAQLQAATLEILGWLFQDVENSDMAQLHVQGGAEVPGEEAHIPLVVSISRLRPRSIPDPSIVSHHNKDPCRLMHAVCEQLQANDRVQEHLRDGGYTRSFWKAYRDTQKLLPITVQGMNLHCRISFKAHEMSTINDPSLKLLASEAQTLLAKHSVIWETRPGYTNGALTFTQADFISGKYRPEFGRDQYVWLVSIAKRVATSLPQKAPTASLSPPSPLDVCHYHHVQASEIFESLSSSYGLPNLLDMGAYGQKNMRRVMAAHATMPVGNIPRKDFDVQWTPVKSRLVFGTDLSEQRKVFLKSLWGRFGLGVFSSAEQRDRRVRDRAFVLWARFLGKPEDSPAALELWRVGTADGW